MTQLDVCLRKTDDGWELFAAVGEPGTEHAREMGRQRYPTSHEAASLLAGIMVGATGDERLAQQVRDFVGPLAVDVPSKPLPRRRRHRGRPGR